MNKKLPLKIANPNKKNSKQYFWLCAICTIILISSGPVAFGHGTVISPASRIWNCYQENPENPISAACIAAVASHGTQALYDWNEINQGNANGMHTEVIADGNLASGGRPDKYGGMDQVRNDWVATDVSPGAFTVTWTNSAPHATAYYEVYITSVDWTPDQPLTWDKLVLLTQTEASPAENMVDIPVDLPKRLGRHVIYSIWQRSDSPEAFYSTSDVDFGGRPTSVDDIDNINEGFYLNQNFPNPFHDQCIIDYSIGKRDQVTLKVYDILGQEVLTLVEEEQSKGKHRAILNSQILMDGVYLYVLQSGTFMEAKFVILKSD